MNRTLLKHEHSLSTHESEQVHLYWPSHGVSPSSVQSNALQHSAPGFTSDLGRRKGTGKGGKGKVNKKRKRKRKSKRTIIVRVREEKKKRDVQ